MNNKFYCPKCGEELPAKNSEEVYPCECCQDWPDNYIGEEPELWK
jgi:ribosomal protein L37AE/L43A